MALVSSFLGFKGWISHYIHNTDDFINDLLLTFSESTSCDVYTAVIMSILRQKKQTLMEDVMN